MYNLWWYWNAGNRWCLTSNAWMAQAIWLKHILSSDLFVGASSFYETLLGTDKSGEDDNTSSSSSSVFSFLFICRIFIISPAGDGDDSVGSFKFRPPLTVGLTCLDKTFISQNSQEYLLSARNWVTTAIDDSHRVETAEALQLLKIMKLKARQTWNQLTRQKMW